MPSRPAREERPSMPMTRRSPPTSSSLERPVRVVTAVLESRIRVPETSCSLAKALTRVLSALQVSGAELSRITLPLMACTSGNANLMTLW